MAAREFVELGIAVVTSAVFMCACENGVVVDNLENAVVFLIEVQVVTGVNISLKKYRRLEICYLECCGVPTPEAFMYRIEPLFNELFGQNAASKGFWIS